MIKGITPLTEKVVRLPQTPPGKGLIDRSKIIRRLNNHPNKMSKGMAARFNQITVAGLERSKVFEC